MYTITDLIDAGRFSQTSIAKMNNLRAPNEDRGGEKRESRLLTFVFVFQTTRDVIGTATNHFCFHYFKNFCMTSYDYEFPQMPVKIQAKRMSL